jgi:NADH-quinone oxidoreductase subunit A
VSPPPLFSPWEPGALSLAVYWLLVLGLTGVLLLLSGSLGARRPDAEKDRAYESGIVPTGPARLHRPVPFYLVAMFFLVFDVETAFLVLWAVAYDRLGWAGLASIAVFVGVLLVGLGYVWRKGGLDWGIRQGGRP